MRNEGFQKEIIDMINQSNQSPQAELDAESEIEMQRLNKIMKESRIKAVLDGNINEVAGLVERGWISLQSLHILPLEYFDKGEFEKCFKCLVTVAEIFSLVDEKDLLSDIERFKDMFIQQGYQNPIPEPFDSNYPQSIENSDETYEELKVIKQLNAATSENEFQSIMQSVKRQLEASNYEVRANAFFIMGDIQFLQGNLQEAIHGYAMALNINPNKALYWGYLAQTLNKAGEHPLLSSRYCMRAIELDSENPKWHLLQSIFLLRLIKEGYEELSHQAIAEAYKALSLCRPDQISLKAAINKFITQQ